tara:strand:+ start:2297 stop:2794 length:498 start_codon:yes stop_codon:yes gene_type:complete
MSKKIPEDIKLQAMKLFLEGNRTAKEIAKIVSTEEFEVKPVTIYAWARREKWNEQSAVARANEQEKLVKSDAKKFNQLQEKQLTSYTKLADKTSASLEYLDFDKALDASRAMDLAIRGQREVMQGMLNMQFVQDVLGVLIDEIKDQEQLSRIAIKMKTLVQNQGE